MSVQLSFTGFCFNRSIAALKYVRIRIARTNMNTKGDSNKRFFNRLAFKHMLSKVIKLSLHAVCLLHPQDVGTTPF